MKPVRIQLSRCKGFSLQAYSRSVNGLPAINCARPGKLGNPFTAKTAIDAGFLAIGQKPNRFLTECFRDWIGGPSVQDGRDWWQGPESDARKKAILDALPALRWHNLACWCDLDEPHCHADVLLELANR